MLKLDDVEEEPPLPSSIISSLMGAFPDSPSVMAGKAVMEPPMMKLKGSAPGSWVMPLHHLPFLHLHQAALAWAPAAAAITGLQHHHHHPNPAARLHQQTNYHRHLVHPYIDNN